ncbi:MAG: DegV family protein [Eubacteriales bacterium]|nr:DegV family protein [Eubacteriales bacterium]
MAIRIITDSAADYSASEIEKRNITCVPMTITFGEETFLDGTEITKEDFFERLINEKELPKTSQPSPTSFLECFEEAKRDGDTVIAILVSGSLSGTIQCAELAKSMAEYDDIHIIDSRLATLGMRFLVDRAVAMRDQGCTAVQIVDALEMLKSKVRIYAGLDTLEYLQKGGRLSRAEAGLGKMVNLKPILTFSREGAVELCSKQIGVRHAYRHIAKLLEEHVPDESYPVYFLYSHEKKNCVGFIQHLQKKGIEFGTPKLRGIGATIGTHIGPGAFGIVFVEQ